MLTLETLLNYHRQYFEEKLAETTGLRFGQFVVNNLPNDYTVVYPATISSIFYEKDTMKAFDMLLQLVEE